MALSARYHTLYQQLVRLRERLLPSPFNPTGQYSDRKLTRAIAYRVLAHAEIESYLEDRARDIAKTALANYKSSGKSSHVLTALVAFSGRSMELPPPSVQPPQANKKNDWEERLLIQKKIDSAAAAFFYSLNNNHGVKEENLLKLLAPIGYPADTLDPVWLAQMNSFGEQRGQAAHQSCSFAVQAAPDPKSELQTVMDLLKGIKVVDAELNKLF